MIFNLTRWINVFALAYTIANIQVQGSITPAQREAIDRELKQKNADHKAAMKRLDKFKI